MIRMPAMRDTSGRASHTLLFVTLAMLAAIGAFVWRTWQGGPTVPTLSEFGTAVMTILAPLVAREWVKPASGGAP